MAARASAWDDERPPLLLDARCHVHRRIPGAGREGLGFRV